MPAALPADHDDDDGGAAGRAFRWRLGSGIGSELRRPLGIAMVGGLLFSQVLTLYTTPVIYIFFDNLAHRFARKRDTQSDGRREPQAAEQRMNSPRHSSDRPVATTLLTMAMAIAGAIAFTVLPVSPLPQVDFPTITVRRACREPAPEIMASSVATPLERQFGHIAGRDGDDLVELAGQHARSRCSSI